MSKEQEFPQALVKKLANEMSEAFNQSLYDRSDDSCWNGPARLSLRREVEACAPLVEALERAEMSMRGCLHREAHGYALPLAQSILAAHRARYAPKPEPTLAEAVEAYMRLWPEHGDALKQMREALARERQQVKP